MTSKCGKNKKVHTNHLASVSLNDVPDFWGQVAAVERSHMNDLILFERTIEQITETRPLAPKQ